MNLNLIELYSLIILQQVVPFPIQQVAFIVDIIRGFSLLKGNFIIITIGAFKLINRYGVVVKVWGSLLSGFTHLLECSTHSLDGFTHCFIDAALYHVLVRLKRRNICRFLDHAERLFP